MKKLVLSQSDKKIAGVAGGIAEYLNVDATLIRLAFVAGIFIGGASIPVYVVAWIIMPQKDESTTNKPKKEDK